MIIVRAPRERVERESIKRGRGGFGCGRVVMDFGKGRCMERCVGGAYDKSIINRIMLRYRPIAPKPATGGSGSQTEKKNLNVFTKRAKRKYVKVRKRREKTKSADEERKGSTADKTIITTLQLLPEKTEQKGSPTGGSCCKNSNDDRKVQDSSTALENFNKNSGGLNFCELSDRPTSFVMPQETVVVESLLTVECVTDTCTQGELGSTDLERRRNLEVDTCPGFISDGYNRVEWVNEAYKRMMMVKQLNNGVGGGGDVGGEQSPALEMMVCLETKEKLSGAAAFTSRVRVQNRSGGKEKCSRMVPCDTWRMDCGGFAWRLDVKAALSLGRC